MGAVGVSAVRVCRACGEEKPLDEYHNVGKRGKGYHALDCKPCANARFRAHRRTNIEAIRQYDRQRHRAGSHRPTKEQRREYARRWRVRHPGHRSPSYGVVYFRPTVEAQRAHNAVLNELLAGRMERPSECSRCGRRNRRIEAAHRDYSKPLEVEWLCTSCHRIEDKANPKGGVRRPGLATNSGSAGEREGSTRPPTPGPTRHEGS